MSGKRMKKKGTESPSSPGTPLTVRSKQYSLTRDFDAAFDQFGESFDGFFTPFLPIAPLTSMLMTEMPFKYPAVHLVDNRDHYTVTTELPGFTKESVHIQIHKHKLQIKAQKKTETEEKRKNHMCKERTYSAFERTVTFPEQVVPSKCDCEMKNDVLELTIPKRDPKPEEEEMTKTAMK
jgi:HSP20 family protein